MTFLQNEINLPNLTLKMPSCDSAEIHNYPY